MHVVITGASSGIGEALAREYGRAGAKLTLVARRRDVLQRIAGEIGGGAHVVAADLSDLDGCTAFLADAERAHGPIDVLVNNAGAQIVAPWHTVDDARAEQMMRLDLLAPLRALSAALPAMVARGSGVVVNVCSVASFSTVAGMHHYNAAKAGLAAASETLRAELRGTGVHVLTVYPGPVTTPLAEAGRAAYEPTFLMTLFTPEGTPDVLARRIRRAVDRRAARLVYPRFYWLSRIFQGLNRAITDRLTPPVRTPGSTGR